MVCKKSLYCWKNGPCASDQTRKQIWEDNIRFRESLRDLNQADSFWSFQISKNSCLCLEGEEFYCGRPLSRKYRTGSLPRLNQIDCASVTHDCNGLKFRNCYVHCPIHSFSKNEESRRVDTPIPQISQKPATFSSTKHPLRPLPKSDEDATEYCRRYRNTLSSNLKPSMKTKFASQSNLNLLGEKSSLEKKSFHVSCENLTNRTLKSRTISPMPKVDKPRSEKNHQLKPKQPSEKTEPDVCPKKSETSMCDKNVEANMCDTASKIKKSKKELKPVIKCPDKEALRGYTPVSRTTRKMLSETKQIPFLTYGCNNNNMDIGTKRTHNVLASKLEVYPNALSAKQHKKDLIMKYIQSEKEFQRKCLPDNVKRRVVNHSSLWSLDQGKENKTKEKRSTRCCFPAMSKPTRKFITVSNNIDPLPFKTYRKPQIYFY